MEVEIINSINRLKEIEQEWEVAERKNNDTLYIKYDFIEKWITHVFDEDDRLFIIVVKEKDRILGVAPLYIQNRKIPIFTVKELKFIGNGDYKNFILDETSPKKNSIIKKILDTIGENKDQYDRIILDKIDGNSYLAHYLFKDNRYNKDFKFYSETPILNLEQIRQEGKLAFKPSKLNKFKNKLKKEVGYYFEAVEDIDEELFEKITNLHKDEQEYLKANKNRKNRRSIFFLEGLNHFYYNYVIGNKNMILFILKTDKDEIINYKLCYKNEKIIYSWNSAYNIKFDNYNLNSIIYSEIFDYLLKSTNIDIFDFGAGRYPWKFVWTNEFNTAYNYEHWNLNGFKIKLAYRLINFKKIINSISS